MRRGVLIVISIAVGCQPPTREAVPAARPRPVVEVVPVSAALADAAAAYRREKTFAALERVVARLEPGMARRDVERILGEPDGWDDPSIFYRGDRLNAARESVGVTLDFYLWFTDGRPTRPSDRLEQWAFGPGNRWEEGDPNMRKREPPPPMAVTPELDAAAARYRQNRAYADLQSLLGPVRLGTPRAEIERLLGPTHGCRPEGSCHYRTDRRNPAGLVLGVEVDYRVHNLGGTASVTTGRLESLRLGPLVQ